MKKPEILISGEQIKYRINELAQEISIEYKNKNPLLIGVLNGAFIFLADLARALEFDLETDFVRCMSYQKSQSSGNPIITALPKTNVKGREVLIVEDIADTGHTLSLLKKEICSMGAESVRTAVFLDKPSRREVEFVPDYTGFVIEDKFVVGYGLDYDERYRNLPYLAALEC